MIEVKNLYHDYTGKGKYAVSDVSFQIDENQIFGFLGPSGTGKSTVQNIMTGLLKLQQGEVLYGGEKVSKIRRAFFNRIGVSFEHPNLYTKLSGLENLRYYAGLFDVPTRPPLELLELVDLREAANRKVAAYSKGMKQRLVFTRALAVTPLGLHRYVIARTLGAVIVASLVTTGTALILSGTAINYLLLTIAIAASILIIAALTLTVGGFANNQVSAIAVIKVLMPIYLALPIVSLFVPERWQLIFYPLPNYWQFQMLRSIFFGSQMTGSFWMALLLTLLLSGALLLIMLKITRGRLMPAGGD